jgi:hypothetical protein
MQSPHLSLSRNRRWLRAAAIALAASAALFTAGCAERTYVAVPPPPPPGPSPLVEQAEHNGFRIGMEDGSRDLANGFGYHPRRDRAFHETPGYDPRFGPLGAYQGYFRNAYMRGYNQAFNRR